MPFYDVDTGMIFIAGKVGLEIITGSGPSLNVETYLITFFTLIL
jgi:hypothetical protein